MINELTYAEKNKDVITFHKLMDFMFHPEYFKMKYIDMIIPEEDKEVFLVGTAFEDKLRLSDDEWNKKYEIKEKNKKRTVSSYRDTNESGRFELTAGKGKTILKGVADFSSQPLSNYDPKRSSVRIHCYYKGICIGGEVDELITDSFEAEGRVYPGAISDVKTTANLRSLRWDLISCKDFGQQYKQQLAWYQFIQQVNLLEANPEMSPKDALYAGLLKVTSKEDNPMTEIFLATPESLIEHRTELLRALDELVVCLKNNDFGKMSRELLLKKNDAYPYHSEREQKKYTLI